MTADLFFTLFCLNCLQRKGQLLIECEDELRQHVGGKSQKFITYQVCSSFSAMQMLIFTLCHYLQIYGKYGRSLPLGMNQNGQIKLVLALKNKTWGNTILINTAFPNLFRGETAFSFL